VTAFSERVPNIKTNSTGTAAAVFFHHDYFFRLIIL
jgi:hypothetical protein